MPGRDSKTSSNEIWPVQRDRHLEGLEGFCSFASFVCVHGPASFLHRADPMWPVAPYSSALLLAPPGTRTSRFSKGVAQRCVPLPPLLQAARWGGLDKDAMWDIGRSGARGLCVGKNVAKLAPFFHPLFSLSLLGARGNLPRAFISL